MSRCYHTTMANWDRITSRGRVEDRRGFAPAAGGISLTGVLLILAFNYFTGGSMIDALSQIQSLPVNTSETKVSSEYDGLDEYETFASTVLGSNNEVWDQQFASIQRQYVPPRLVLFRTATDSGCGTATSQIGPHYCPPDNTIYLDETFFDELTSRLGAQGGDVAEAYVIAHEIGHHVQNQLGVFERVQSQRNNPDEQNEISVRMELQADCYAGVWASSLKGEGVLEPGEIREAMDAAAAVGDDRIQQKATGSINPESWTHGSSEQRVEWFTRGYDSGLMSSCDTFQ
jgi:uncharacterized protein